MLLEKVSIAGPLRDTIIQRWRDPIDGSVCFVYLPISAPLLPQPADGYVQYGPSQIGSISCIHPTQVLQLWQGEGAPPVPARQNGAERATQQQRGLIRWGAEPWTWSVTPRPKVTAAHLPAFCRSVHF